MQINSDRIEPLEAFPTPPALNNKQSGTNNNNNSHTNNGSVAAIRLNPTIKQQLTNIGGLLSNVGTSSVATNSSEAILRLPQQNSTATQLQQQHVTQAMASLAAAGFHNLPSQSAQQSQQRPPRPINGVAESTAASVAQQLAAAASPQVIGAGGLGATNLGINFMHDVATLNAFLNIRNGIPNQLLQGMAAAYFNNGAASIGQLWPNVANNLQAFSTVSNFDYYLKCFFFK